MKTVDVVFALLMLLAVGAPLVALAWYEVRRQYSGGVIGRDSRNRGAMMRLSRSIEAAARDLRGGGPAPIHDELRGWAAMCRHAADEQLAVVDEMTRDALAAADAGPVHLGDLPARKKTKEDAHART